MPNEELDLNKQAQEEQLKALKELKKVKDSKEFETYFNKQIESVAYKITWAFMATNKEDNVKNYDDFCRVRGEVIATLAPIMEIYGVDAVIQALTQNLKENYKQPV